MLEDIRGIKWYRFTPDNTCLDAHNENTSILLTFAYHPLQLLPSRRVIHSRLKK